MKELRTGTVTFLFTDVQVPDNCEIPGLDRQTRDA
jgi:hypothetical protein